MAVGYWTVGRVVFRTMRKFPKETVVMVIQHVNVFDVTEFYT